MDLVESRVRPGVETVLSGLDAIGLVHTLLGAAALLSGLAILVLAKGTRAHRATGRAYVASMLLLNVTALAIYDLWGRFGPFHWASVASLATVVAAFVPVRFRRPREGWMRLHATLMCWSYVGLVAAFASEIATRIPGFRFGPSVVIATGIVVLGGALLIYVRLPATVVAVAKHRR